MCRAGSEQLTRPFTRITIGVKPITMLNFRAGVEHWGMQARAIGQGSGVAAREEVTGKAVSYTYIHRLCIVGVIHRQFRHTHFQHAA